MDEREQRERQEVPPEVWEEPKEGASRPQQPQAQGLNYYIREEPAMPRGEGANGPAPYGAYGPPPQGAPYYGQNGGPPPVQNPNPVPPAYNAVPPAYYAPNAQPPYQAGPPPQGAPYYGQNGGPPPTQNPNQVPPAYNAAPPAYHAPNAQPPYQYGQQSYQQPQNGAYNGGQPSQDDIKHKNCSRLSLIFGIAAYVLPAFMSIFIAIPFMSVLIQIVAALTIPLAIAAIALGAYGKTGKRPGYGMGIAGMTLGIVYFALGFIGLFMIFAFIGLLVHA